MYVGDPGDTGDTAPAPTLAELVDGDAYQARLDALAALAETYGDRSVGTKGEVAALDWARAELEGLGWAVTAQAVTVQSADSFNLVATSPFGSADKIVAVGAHIDTVSETPGINDNGTGAAVLGIVEALSLRESPPPRQVRILLFTAEESGAWGSLIYTYYLSDAEIAAHRAYLNVDMIGSPNGVPFIMDTDGSQSGVVSLSSSSQVLEDLIDRRGCRRSRRAQDRGAGGGLRRVRIARLGGPASGAVLPAFELRRTLQPEGKRDDETHPTPLDPHPGPARLHRGHQGGLGGRIVQADGTTWGLMLAWLNSDMAVERVLGPCGTWWSHSRPFRLGSCAEKRTHCTLSASNAAPAPVRSPCAFSASATSASVSVSSIAFIFSRASGLVTRSSLWVRGRGRVSVLVAPPRNRTCAVTSCPLSRVTSSRNPCTC